MKQESWQEQLDNKIQYIIDAGFNLQDYETSDMLASFISKLLDEKEKQIKQEIIEKISPIRDLTQKEKGKSLDYWEGYTKAKGEFINKLTQKI